MQPWITRGVLAVLAGIALGVAGALGPAVFADRQAGADALPAEEARLLAEVIERVKLEYVDRVDGRELVEAAIRGMIADLDPHSAYLDSNEFSDVRISTSGRYTGIGVELGVDGDRLVIVAPVDGGPADRAGIRAGDIVLAVNRLAVGAADLDEAIKEMRGAAGTQVALAVRRSGIEAPMIFELERSHVALQSVRAMLLGGGDAYARITHFTDATPADLRHALGELRRAAGGPLRGLVLDLRGNPGGVLDAAIEVADIFLDGGLIVAAEGRIAESRFRATASPGDALDGAPMTVLVNQGSASAAEIVAGALKDQQRATLVGTRTFGKGSVQTIIPLSGGRAVKLTTARYYTPTGLSIHARGISPDLLVESSDVEGEDPQLAAAVAALLGRHVTPLGQDVVAAGPRRD